MAEFIEIVKIKVRMCKKYDRCATGGCPLSSYNNGSGQMCNWFLEDFPEKYEQICLDWAKENPEITNADKLYQLIKEAYGEYVANKIVNKLDIEKCSCSYVKCLAECSICDNKNFWNKPYVELKETE